MKNTKIVLVAQWDGWCGACAVERPLVLTRSGRLGLRTWLTAPVAEPRPLTLTCRLCGTTSVVPREQDDPPVLVELEDASALEPPALLVPARVPAPAVEAPGPSWSAPVPALTALAVAPVPVLHPAASQAASTVATGPELDQARGALGDALRALLAQRTAEAVRVTPSVSVVVDVPAVAAHLVPLQRTSSSDADSLATLQLLAEGLDLLSASRA